MEALRQLLALALVFGLLGLAVWLLRGRRALRWRRGGGARREPRRLESMDRLALSPQHALHLVRASDRVLLLVTHSGGCTLLAQLPQPAQEAGFGAPLAASAAALEKVLG